MDETFAVISISHATVEVVHDEDGVVWPARAISDAPDEQQASAETSLSRGGWRKVGRWATSRQDPDHLRVRVERMNDDDLVTSGDIARLAGVQPATVQAWTERHADFPAPAQTLGVTRAWRWGDVAEWLAIPRPSGRPRKG